MQQATATRARVTDSLIWAPQAGPQKALVDCPLPEIFFGGARGGGKTDGVLGKYAIKALRYGSAFNALFCRRELPMLDDAIERSKGIYGPLGAKWQDQPKTWRFPGGGRLRFRPLERVEDADKYQGQNITDVCIEEAGQYPDPRPIDRLNAVLRSASGVPTQMILTGNPGGTGQAWIRQRYISPAPFGWKVIERRIEMPEHAGGGYEVRRSVFIPSRVSDNRYLGRDYIAGLHLVGSAALVKAWLNGDWDAIEGAFFDCWDAARHVVMPFKVPVHWTRFLSKDWGFASPGSVGWWAVASDAVRVGGVTIPRGCLVRYREWYVAKGPGVGARLEAEQLAAGILARERADRERRDLDPSDDGRWAHDDPAISYSVGDGAMFDEAGRAYGYRGPSIAERMAKAGVVLRPADKRRKQGWDQMRARFKGDADGNPMLVVFSTCTDFINTVPGLQHDAVDPEDLDTDGEDHIADEARYACMSRPYTRVLEPAQPAKLLSVGETNTVTLDDLWDSQPKARERRI